MNKLAPLILIASLVSCACGSGGTPPPNPPPPIPVQGDECERGEARIRQLGCKRADGTLLHTSKAGKPWATFCRERLEAGDYINADCVSKIMDCDRLESASRIPRERTCQ